MKTGTNTPAMNVPAQSLMGRTTMVVNVTGLTAWRWRIRCGMWLVGLACRVIGCGFKVEP